MRKVRQVTWLVTGGAGYIGAHVVRTLVAHGYNVVILDDLSTGVSERVPKGTPLEQGTVVVAAFVHRVFDEYDVTGVVHLAAKKQLGESMEQPLKYYGENVAGLISLLNACRQQGVDRFLFSSSAAVYGLSNAHFLTEDTPPRPLSPYGETKLVGEMLLNASHRAYGIRCVILRYFNVAGAATDELGDIGGLSLIPMVFERLARIHRAGG